MILVVFETNISNVKFVLWLIPRIALIASVDLCVALKACSDADWSLFSITLLVPRIIMHLASRQLVLANFMCMIAKTNFACRDFLTGLPVLFFLQVGTPTLRKLNRTALSGADCFGVEKHTIDNCSPQCELRNDLHTTTVCKWRTRQHSMATPTIERHRITTSSILKLIHFLTYIILVSLIPSNTTS